MSKYLPLFWDWRQHRAILYRVYINIFAIFLRIPILPMGFSWKYKTFDIYYRGEEIICYFKKGKLRYQSIYGGHFNKLSEIDKYWIETNKELERLSLLNPYYKKLEKLKRL